MALALLETGHRLVAMGRSEEGLLDFAAEVRERGFAERLLTVRGDVTNGEQCRLVIDAGASALGHVDFLINNAGAHMPHAHTAPKFYG